MSVQEKERIQGLVLCGGGHAPLDGQVCQERLELAGTHLSGMALAVKQDVAANPTDVGLLGSRRIVSPAEDFSDLIEESWGL